MILCVLILLWLLLIAPKDFFHLTQHDITYYNIDIIYIFLCFSKEKVVVRIFFGAGKLLQNGQKQNQTTAHLIRIHPTILLASTKEST